MICCLCRLLVLQVLVLVVCKDGTSTPVPKRYRTRCSSKTTVPPQLLTSLDCVYFKGAGFQLRPPLVASLQNDVTGEHARFTNSFAQFLQTCSLYRQTEFVCVTGRTLSLKPPVRSTRQNSINAHCAIGASKTYSRIADTRECVQWSWQVGLQAYKSYAVILTFTQHPAAQAVRVAVMGKSQIKSQIPKQQKRLQQTYFNFIGSGQW